MEINVVEVTVLQTQGTDVVLIQTDMTPPITYLTHCPAVLKVECTQGSGVEWVRTNLQMEPKVVTTGV